MKRRMSVVLQLLLLYILCCLSVVVTIRVTLDATTHGESATAGDAKPSASAAARLTAPNSGSTPAVNNQSSSRKGSSFGSTAGARASRNEKARQPAGDVVRPNSDPRRQIDVGGNSRTTTATTKHHYDVGGGRRGHSSSLHGGHQRQHHRKGYSQLVVPRQAEDPKKAGESDESSVERAQHHHHHARSAPPSSPSSQQSARRVVVLQYSDRLARVESYRRYGQRNQEYCAFHGYEYRVEPDLLDRSKSRVWSYSWQKLLMVLAAFQSGKYDYAVWLDDDACINDRHMGTRVEDFFQDGDEHALVLARGSHNGIYNTGVLFFRNSPELPDLINLWLNDTEHCPTAARNKRQCCPEQDCLYQIWNGVRRTPYQDLAPFPAFSRHAEYKPHPLFSRLVRPLLDFEFSCSPVHPPNWSDNKCFDPFIFHFAGSKDRMSEIFNEQRSWGAAV